MKKGYKVYNRKNNFMMEEKMNYNSYHIKKELKKD